VSSNTEELNTRLRYNINAVASMQRQGPDAHHTMNVMRFLAPTIGEGNVDTDSDGFDCEQLPDLSCGVADIASQTSAARVIFDQISTSVEQARQQLRNGPVAVPSEQVPAAAVLVQPTTPQALVALSRPKNAKSQAVLHRAITGKIEALRENENARHDFRRSCEAAAALKVENTRLAIANLNHAVLRPADTMRDEARLRRHEQRTQMVMNATSTLALRTFEPGTGDSVLQRRWVLLLTVMSAFRSFAEAAVSSVFRHHRNANSSVFIDCFDLNQSLGAHMQVARAMRTVDRACVRFAINRRVRHKRDAINVVRRFMRVRAYIVLVRNNVKKYRTSVIACQRIARAWGSRRATRLDLWHKQWMAVEDRLEGTPILTDALVACYERLVRHSLSSQHRKFTSAFLADVRRFKAHGSVGLAVAPFRRVLFSEREVEPLVEVARATIIDFANQVDRGASISELWEKKFNSKRTASVALPPDPFENTSMPPSAPSTAPRYMHRRSSVSAQRAPSVSARRRSLTLEPRMSRVSSQPRVSRTPSRPTITRPSTPPQVPSGFGS
jgi:hypothetical protein